MLKIRDFKNFPKKGVYFKDITPILAEGQAIRKLSKAMYDHYRNNQPETVAVIESRGFILGSILAYKLKSGIALIRKAGKLPGKRVSVKYDCEYGKGILEMHTELFKEGTKVLIFDDVLATGGTARAAAELVKKAGGEVIGYCFLIEINVLRGRDKLQHPVYSLMRC